MDAIIQFSKKLCECHALCSGSFWLMFLTQRCLQICTVSSVLEAAASIFSRGSMLRLEFKGGLYLRAASNTDLLNLREIRTKKLIFSFKIDVF